MLFICLPEGSNIPYNVEQIKKRASRKLKIILLLYHLLFKPYVALNSFKYFQEIFPNLLQFPKTVPQVQPHILTQVVEIITDSFAFSIALIKKSVSLITLFLTHNLKFNSIWIFKKHSVIFTSVFRKNFRCVV